MPKIIINEKEIEFEKGMTVLQACELADVEIPRFCYHEKLSIAGNCRMCLVEMEKSAKPIASCAMPAAEGMKIKTNTAFVEKATSQKTAMKKALEMYFDVYFVILLLLCDSYRSVLFCRHYERLISDHTFCLHL